ncbi:hypothetical protein F8M41_007628 [Gigaspora margarita]|uniref:Uncharacterized protein n=1 Tax=Gigaspora margarita TaxID=4874 RepID=A0A8H3X4M5_GIGMA|nr:hypothetical protein F8M41_007628 [Gigaspora margarita]
MVISRTETKDLPCLFKFLARDYPGSELALCETPEKQRWQYADTFMVENKAKNLVKNLSKLLPLLGSLNDYSVYQKYYNNIIKHVKTVVEIAKRERTALYDDVVKLINDHEQFCLNSLLNYSPSQWLIICNPVVVEFIKTLMHNENENYYEGKKLFKCAVAIDNIYRIRYLKYVSSINLSLLAIKYSISKSKMIVDIDSHIINASSFTKFINWQETLAGSLEPFPNGLLHDYLSTELYIEKNEEINVIDDLITNQSAKTKNQKECRECEKEQPVSDKKEKDSIKPLTFRSYQPNASKSGKSDNSTSLISITQNLEPQDDIKISNILVSDPLLINSNSIDNVCKVFDHIQNISGVNNGNRR